MNYPMGQIGTYIVLFGLIVIIGQIFKKSTIPLALLLVITGMLLSLLPWLPHIVLKPEIVLNIFLPLLVYQISSFASWKDFKKNLRPITLLSVGHVVFITFLVALLIHALIPELGWPLSFVLGSVISPPDDVAIVSIAEKIRLPERIVTILEGEGILNDATALILFRLSLIALVTHQFLVVQGTIDFFAIVIGETLYGLVLGYIIGELRARISNNSLHMIASLLTPFLAYYPAVLLGGCGVLATVVTGFVIGNIYAVRFSPEFRLFSRAFWPTLSFGLQSFIFLLVGLDFRFILGRISSISPLSLLIYSGTLILAVIVGRFLWVYAAAILPRFLFSSIRKKDPYPTWQSIFVISWSGMRGGISLAAALAVPFLPGTVKGANPNDLLLFLVFSVITTTFVVQGLTLPWLINVLGIQKSAKCEEYNEHITELNARLTMTKAVLRWLSEYKDEVKDDPKLLEQVKLYIREYRMLKNQLKERIADHREILDHDEQKEAMTEIFLLSQILEIEKVELLELWRKEKINLAVRNKLLERLDHRVKHLAA